jgi:hypothetical protein
MLSSLITHLDYTDIQLDREAQLKLTTLKTLRRRTVDLSVVIREIKLDVT